ncbi:MAG: cupin domain-containing protein [Lactococcus chungangensis]|jgi:Cupin domain.|uniref:Cupin domain-containing protein n=1 Tax=Pseudolactococcus chungangensis TaxID=451457 RepID=A0A847J2V4_9LACT|nr:cupin domain-containing protein [Lactococcus chungangensis]
MTLDNDAIEIARQTSAISVTKSSGTQVAYYLYPEFEIHVNILPAGVVQDWHKHVQLDENVIVTSGEITVEYLENGHVSSQTIQKNDVLRVKRSIHRLLNQSSEPAQFIVFRFVPTGQEQSELMKQDKVDCENEIK